MSKTYLLKTLKTVRFPDRFIVMHRVGEYCQWVCYDYKEGLWHLAHEMSEDSSLTLWEELASWCHARSNTWMAGWKMYEQLSELGLFEALEEGCVRLKQKRRLVTDGSAQSNWAQQAGALVCDSPPTIIDLEFAPKLYLRCIDLLNWGLEHDEWVKTVGDDSIDCPIQALQDYVVMTRALDMGTLAATASAQGYNRFRTRDITCKIAVHQDMEARKVERDAHFGGRCEVFRVGPIPGPLYYVDVKAMYSSIAFCERFPTDLIDTFRTHNDGLRIIDDVESYYIASVCLRTDEPRYPVRIGLHTYYPVGEFLTTLCDPELRMAIKAGHIAGGIRAQRYRQDYVWRDYARWYFESLDNLDALGLSNMRSALKLAVNASFGKVGVRGKRWVDCEPDETGERWGQWWRRHPETDEMTQGRAIDGIHQYLDAGGEPSSSMPALAAAMPSYGRVWAWNMMIQAGRGNVFYIDTDGFVVNSEGYFNLPIQHYSLLQRPGDLVLRRTVDDVWIGGLKHYRLGDEWVQSGVPRSAERSADGRAEWTEREPFGYGLWHGEPFNVREVARTRYGCRPYEHGTVGPDLRVSPLRADVLDGPDGPENVLYGVHGEIRASKQKKLLTSRPAP